MTAMTPRIWVINQKDNVGTVIIADVAEQMQVEIVGSTAGTLDVSQPIPFGHKAALVNLAAGSSVVKYGVVIGRTRSDIRAGEHVHVHNLESLRGRGDLQADLGFMHKSITIERTVT